MWFLNPLFLFGATALAAPIIVHLVRRSRAKRVEFASLMFVRQVPQRTVGRQRLHNLLLLAMRCLALLLLIFAFTRPYLTSNNTNAKIGDTDGASVILFDTSFSMRYGDRFTTAKNRVRALLDIAPAGEQFALVNFNQTYNVLARFTPDRARIPALLDGVQAGWNATDYEQALRGAEELLQEADQPLRTVYLVTDFQATGWNTTDTAYRLPSNIKLVPIDVGGAAAANLAVTEVSGRGVVYGQKYTDRVTARIGNFSDEARDNVPIDFRINDGSIERRNINIPARDFASVEFTNFNLSNGVNRCVISVGSGDSSSSSSNDNFNFDNSFYFILRRLPQAKALIVDTAGRGQASSLFLQSALTTGENLPFTVTVKSAGSTNPTEIPEYSLVILNDVRSVSSDLLESLERFVQAGGGLIIAAGRNTSATDFNRTLTRLLAPITLNEAVVRPGETSAMSEFKRDHPIFEVFRDSGGRAGAWRVFGYHRSEPRENASVLARFEDGSPALVEATIGQGKVLLFTSALDTSWSDLPLTPLYLPLVRQMVRYVSEQEATPWHLLGQTFTVPKAPGTEQPPAVDTPGNERLTERTFATTGDLIVAAREPGFYRLRYPEAIEYAAVDTDGKESDFSKLNLDEFLAGVTTSADEASQETEATAATAEPGREEAEARQRIWWPLLLAALMLFVAEAILARRTRMAKVIG